MEHGGDVLKMEFPSNQRTLFVLPVRTQCTKKQEKWNLIFERIIWRPAKKWLMEGGKDGKFMFQKLSRYLQSGVIKVLETFFTWYGEVVATHPVKAIVICILATILGGAGLLNFYEEGDAAALVIPRHSEFRKNIDWLDDNFPREIRVHSVVYQADNVLTPQVLQTMYRQRKKMEEIQVSTGRTFGDLCVMVPIVKFPKDALDSIQLGEDTYEETTVDWGDDGGFDEMFEEYEAPNILDMSGGVMSLLGSFMSDTEVDIEALQELSNSYYPEPYCSVVKATENACYELDILELWGDDGKYSEITDIKIQALTTHDILDKINNKNVSQIFLKEKNFTELLGDIKYGPDGKIIGAGAVEFKFFTTVNVTAVKEFGTVSRGEKIDQEAFDMEGELIKLFTDRSEFPGDVEINSYVNVQRQFFESFVGQTFNDADKLVLGYLLVFIYVNVMLSKLNFVEQRVWLSTVGVFSIFMGMIAAYGICSAFGLFYSAAHTIIPFLLLGIGIDNIFVITQAFDTLTTTTDGTDSLEKKMGKTMGHAGVAISVTTFTDVIAFGVGSNTVLPGLESFCIYASVSILVIYMLQATHFVAWMSLDQRRMDDRRDGCICCIKHNNFKPLEISKVSYLNVLFGKIGKGLNKTVVKVVVVLMTLLFVGGGIWGASCLTQEYQPEWLLPPESEIAKWFNAKKFYFPGAGEPGFVMISQIDIPGEFDKVDSLVKQLQADEDNIEWVNPWHDEFRNYVNRFKEEDKVDQTFTQLMANDTYFRHKFTQFLFSPKGAIFQANFWFDDKLECGQAAPNVSLQAIPYGHKRFDRSTEWVPAMRKVEQIVEEINFSNDSFAMALTYINWKTDAIVAVELLRNVGIALVCIFVTTLGFLGSWRGSMFVMMCVLLTFVDVSGFMHWWNLTIDITSMNCLIISVGLCVDFCGHIVHGFLIGNGSKASRVEFVMENVAPAVMNGGFSSLLALSLLVASQSHIFICFFKIFFMIIVFGLFHGLITLPVILTWLGPLDSHDEKQTKHKNKDLVPNGVKVESSDEVTKILNQNKNNQERELAAPETLALMQNLKETNIL